MKHPFTPVLTVNNLSVLYSQGGHCHCVLNDVSFSLGKGEVLTLLGESGSGKTTCGKAIMGLLPPSAKIESGSLQLGSNTVMELSSPAVNWNHLRGKHIAMIYQDAQLALNPVRTIRDHFQETLRYHRLGTAAEIEAKSKETLEMLNFDDPERVLSSYPFELSGGMCQRVYIALVLCLQPDVLIADEPTSALDVVIQKEVLNLLKEVQKQFELSILLITHDIGVAYKVSDRIIVLDKGGIVEEGDMEAVLFHPKQPYTQTLIEARRFPPKMLPVSRKTGELLLRVEQLGKTFGQKGSELRVLNNLNFDVHRRERIGILGCSGCGKSTLARCIAGLETPDQGKILYRGQDITHLKGKKRTPVCKSIQMVFQDARASLNPGRTALKLVQEPLRYLKIGARKAQEKKARYYLEQVGIGPDVQNLRPPQLSTGQCQRVAIARALVLEPDILLCDEAVSALDMIVQRQILNLLGELQENFGFSIVMISHDIRVIRHFCQTVAVMKDGCFHEFVPTERLEQEAGSAYTQLLLSSEIHIDKAV